MPETSAAPLPQRHGIDPVRLRLPDTGRWPTVREYLVERFGAVAADRIDAMLSDGRFHGVDGALAADAPYQPGASVWFHRDLPVEPEPPFALEILHRDEDLVVVHKPHFMATIPRGRHVRHTALARLRTELDLPQLSPAHRLDRATAGVLVFVARPRLRGAYQELFARRQVHKEYEAVAEYRPELRWPRTFRSRIVKRRGVLAAIEEPGEPNAETRVELLQQRRLPDPAGAADDAARAATAPAAGTSVDGAPRAIGRYRLVPTTGRTHQLRLHMSDVGVPILGDRYYPVVTDDDPADFSRPLQLLARAVAFTDPVTGRPRRFETPADLAAFDDYAGWAADRSPPFGHQDPQCDVEQELRTG